LVLFFAVALSIGAHAKKKSVVSPPKVKTPTEVVGAPKTVKEPEIQPVLDQDQDGVLDSLDQCPKAFGFEVYKGCSLRDWSGAVSGVTLEWRTDSADASPLQVKYTGEWARGGPLGSGALEFPHGTTIRGEFKGRYAFGPCRFENAKLTRECQCDVDSTGQKCSALTALIWPSGIRYEGAFVDGLPEGFGKLIQPSGDVYEGNFKQGKPHGLGVLRSAQGTLKSEWRQGLATGESQLTLADGSTWEFVIRGGKPMVADSVMARWAAENLKELPVVVPVEVPLDSGLVHQNQAVLP
jgi:hypothetical protein